MKGQIFDMKQYAIIGLGRFGTSLALTLQEQILEL